MSFYRALRDNYTMLRRELDEIEAIYSIHRREFNRLKSLYPGKRVADGNETLYYELRDMFNNLREKRYSDALLYFYINKTAYSGMIRYNSNGEFNVPFGRYANLNTNIITDAHSRLLQHADISSTDYLNVFNLCHVDDFVFLDPPYDCVFSDYGNDEYKNGFSEDDHRRLAQDFTNLPCKALMVIGRTSLTESLYRGHVVDEYPKTYAVNIRNRFRSAATHIIVTNYRKLWDCGRPAPEQTQYGALHPQQMYLFEAQQPYAKNQ